MTKYNYTRQAAKAVQLAKKTAEELGHAYYGTEHILAGLMREGHGTASLVLTSAGAVWSRLKEMIGELILPENGFQVTFAPEYSPRAKELLKNAGVLSRQCGQEKIGTEHLLLAILEDPACMASRLLYSLGVDMENLKQDLLVSMGEAGAESAMENPENEEHSKTPMLDQFGEDLTKLARDHKMDPVIGRADEIERIIEILSRRTKNNPCLIGEPGVGKTAVVEGLAQRIAEDNVPATIRGKRVISLDLSGMVAGTKFRGEFEQRIKNVISELAENRNLLLFIDEIHTIIGAGGAEGALDASNILKPALARGEIQVIGATTIDEYRKRIEKDAALERRFQPVMVEEPGKEETIEILKGLRPYYEKHHGVSISDEALTAAVEMSVRYINDRFLPDKAIDLIDESAAYMQLSEMRKEEGSPKSVKNAGVRQKLADAQEDLTQALRHGKIEEAGAIRQEISRLKEELGSESKASGPRKRKPVVGREAVARSVSLWTKIPLEKIAEKESRRLARLEKILHKRVIGQDEAVAAVSKAIRRGRVGLKDPERPIGSFLFLGPTGVGKTELSKALAEAVFGSESAMIRIDMSEYMEKHSVSKLIGSPPGYVGYEEGGQLSEKVRRHPYSVLLFDEIEKAHPDVFNILLQVLDDGHITDAQGRKVSFRETIIIMTSNAGASRIISPKRLGFDSRIDEKRDYDQMKEQVLEEVRQLFRPEFLNRIDDIIVFHPLNRKDMNQIIRILLTDLTKRCSQTLNITLRLTQSARDKLIDDSYDVKYGARPLRREIQEKLENPLAEKILGGEVRRGDTVTVQRSGDSLIWNTKA